MAIPYEDIKIALQDDNPEIAIRKTRELLDDVTVLPLSIAITGESGTGKSSLVNSLRGLHHSDPAAAPVGVVETTMEPTPYSHPSFASVTVWDLPGVGTTKMKASEYLQHVGFQKYDFFIIVSNTRFRENDANLALEIKKMDKKFYFVRSKIDSDLYNAKMSQATFDEAETLKKIRDNCIEELEKLGVGSPKVFLLSTFKRLKYDFTKLVETLESEMSEHQRETVLRAVPAYSLEIIQKKKAVLAGKIAGLVTASVFGGLLPFVSIAINEAIINNFVKDCVMTFGLTEQTLQLLSRESGVTVSELKAVMKLSVSPDGGVIAAEALLGVIGPFGMPAQMVLSGVSMSPKLHHILDVTAEDAQNVLKRALLPIQSASP